MGSLTEKIDKFVEFLERDRLSVFGILLWVLFISMLRGYLEPVLHYGSFSFGLFANDVFTGVSSFVGACLVISYFSKTSYKRVMNVAAFGWIIFVTPPLFDFFVFRTLETGTWAFADIRKFTSPLHLIYPLFVIESGFSTGLVFQTIMIYTLLTIYVFWKSRSLKNAALFLPPAFAFGYIQGIMPFFFYIVNRIILEFKLLPTAYEWYFFLFVFWSGFVLFTKKGFKREFLPYFKTPFLLGIVICVLGGVFSLPRFLNSWDLFLKVCVSIFLLTSLNIYLQNKIRWRKFKTFLKSLMLDISKKDHSFRVLEIALCMQVISIVISVCNSILKETPAFALLTLAGVLLINFSALFRNYGKNGRYLYSALIPLAFCLGYSVSYDKIMDIINMTWPFLGLLFAISFIALYFSGK